MPPRRSAPLLLLAALSACTGLTGGQMLESEPIRRFSTRLGSEAIRVGQAQGYTVHTIDPHLLDGEEVRSGRIRTCLLDGDVQGAARQLGRLYQVTGRVVAGAQRGRTIGHVGTSQKVPARPRGATTPPGPLSCRKATLPAALCYGN